MYCSLQFIDSSCSKSRLGFLVHYSHESFAISFPVYDSKSFRKVYTSKISFFLQSNYASIMHKNGRINCSVNALSKSPRYVVKSKKLEI